MRPSPISKASVCASWSKRSIVLPTSDRTDTGGASRHADGGAKRPPFLRSARGTRLENGQRMRSSTVALSLFLLLAACGGSTSSAPSGSSGSSGSSGTSTPDSFVGIYHLDQVDATNLELRADGLYQWSIEGCDFGGGQCGTWKADDEGNIVLESGSAAVEWSYDGSFKQVVQTLTIKKNGGDVTVLGVTDKGKSFEQSWKKGRSCAICGNVGPTGQEECSAPLPKVCGGP